jgi:hypothetical protein
VNAPFLRARLPSRAGGPEKHESALHLKAVRTFRFGALVAVWLHTPPVRLRDRRAFIAALPRDDASR